MLAELEVQFGNTYDSELSETSTNAVQNKVVTEAIYNIGEVIESTTISAKSYVDNEINTLDRKKQDVIADLNEIRNKANTALQEHQDISHLATKTSVSAELSKKVDKVSGKGLSTNDFTNNFKTKLEGLSNYNDSEVKNLITSETNRAKSVEQGLTNAITTINGTGTGSMKKTVADEIAKVIDSAPAAFDTLKEIADYINEDQEAAAVIANDLVEHSNAIEENKSEIVAISKNVTKLSDEKADKDGVYSGMTVGRSIDLLGVEDVEEGSFLFRPTDGDGSIKDGVAVVKSVKGDSVVWNQLYDRKPLTVSGMTITIDGDTTIINGEAQARYFPIKMNVRIPEHKILMVAECVSNPDGLSFNVSDLNSDAKGIDITQSVTFGYCIYTGTHRAAGNAIGLQRFGDVGTIFNNVKIIVRTTDLTKAFPNDWQNINTIEDFNAMVATLGVDLNAYNEGEVVNMKASGIKSVGFNAWDEEWENGSFSTTNGKPAYANTIRCKNAIAVLPNMTYHFNIPIPSSITDKSYMGYALFYNDKDAYINFTPVGGTYYAQCLTPSDARYMRFYLRTEFGTTYNHDICINLVHSGYRNGEYEPYVEDVLALPTLDLFPNGMSKIGDVYDEYDDEKSVQRIGIRPYQSGDESIENVLTDGTSTFYVLEEPIVTPHDYRLAYKAWDFGTEQVIADGNTTAITAGITYEFNARDTIRSNKTRLDVLEPIVAGKIDKVADDYYPQLAVGLADNLSGVDVVDSEVNFRRSGGGVHRNPLHTYIRGIRKNVA